MPRRNDLHSILVIGAGPIIIGQACEFDYSGSQACKALKEEGYRVLLVNSNPATIMTDPAIADKTFVEPVTPDVIRRIVLEEKPDAVLPTVGGQTALNATLKTAEDGFFEKHGVELIGANVAAIRKAEDRQAFNEAMRKIGLKTTKSGFAHSMDEALDVISRIPFPVIIRSSFTLGGTGGAIAYNLEEFKELARKGIELSMAKEIIIEESIVGWKEYELEVMRDHKDNVVIICSIENFDPMGAHTGDSITVAPQQTLPDREYQELRDMSVAIIREIGVSTGGSNIQFAVNPENGEVRVIEMNPRVSRSSALASKATGFPIAKIAAKLAVGYTLDEIPNDITKSTPASFEPTIDYVVTKIPRFAFEKFPSAPPQLGIQMKSVGETMAIGRTFAESVQKGLRGLETGRCGFDGVFFNYKRLAKNRAEGVTLAQFRERLGDAAEDETVQAVTSGRFDRILRLKDAFYLGFDVEDIHHMCRIDRWFLHHLKQIFDMEQAFWDRPLESLTADEWRELKRHGFSDEQIGHITASSPAAVRTAREGIGLKPVYRLVDTCAGEFEARTPYYYSTYEDVTEIRPEMKPTVMVLGGGPNRIGQGIEFDYMCVHASLALREMGYHTVMVNSNPETVSTDYDISDSLFFEPLTLEDVLNVAAERRPVGAIVQLGGQTPLNLCERLAAAGLPLLGTSAESIDIAEDRDRFREILERLGLRQPPSAIFTGDGNPADIADRIGYPVLVRPSFVLGGRAMQIVWNRADLEQYVGAALEASPNQSVLIDKYLERAIEVDVDLVCDGEDVRIAGVMEHIEEAGIHSGDSACILPAQNLSPAMTAQIRDWSAKLARALHVRGLMNIQYAVKDGDLFVLEVNPRGSRTVPFVCKASGVPWVRIATQVIMGKKLADIDIPETPMKHVAVKEAVLPFDKFPDEDTILGPEMKSTGEVMGLASTLGEAYYKAQLAAGTGLPKSGRALITVNKADAEDVLPFVLQLQTLGFEILATEGTAKFLNARGVRAAVVSKLGEGRPDIRDRIMNREIDLIFNTPIGKQAKESDKYLRVLANRAKVPLLTTIWGMEAAVEAIGVMKQQELTVRSLQDWYAASKTGGAPKS